MMPALTAAPRDTPKNSQSNWVPLNTSRTTGNFVSLADSFKTISSEIVAASSFPCFSCRIFCWAGLSPFRFCSNPCSRLKTLTRRAVAASAVCLSLIVPRMVVNSLPVFRTSRASASNSSLPAPAKVAASKTVVAPNQNLIVDPPVAAIGQHGPSPRSFFWIRLLDHIRTHRGEHFEQFVAVGGGGLVVVQRLAQVGDEGVEIGVVDPQALVGV